MSENAVVDFALQFGVKLLLDSKLIVQHDGHFFLLNDNVKLFVKDGFFYAGTFLGKVRSNKFFPSFNLLLMLAKHNGVNYVIIDKRASWLFICGRDVFRKSILQTQGRVYKNNLVLVLNEFEECLGFGRIFGEKLQSTKNKSTKVAIANLLDVGDFLRRERST